jgi:hypothetical protein
MTSAALSDERHAELTGAFCCESYGDRAYLGFHNDQNVPARFVQQQLDGADPVQILRHRKAYPFWP